MFLLVLAEVRVSLGVDDRLLLAVVRLEQVQHLLTSLPQLRRIATVGEGDVDLVHPAPQLAVLLEHDQDRHHQARFPQGREHEALLEVDVAAQGVHRRLQGCHGPAGVETVEVGLDPGVDLVVLAGEGLPEPSPGHRGLLSATVTVRVAMTMTAPSPKVDLRSIFHGSHCENSHPAGETAWDLLSTLGKPRADTDEWFTLDGWA